MRKRLKVLFIGLGSIGQRHLRILKEMADVMVLWVPSGKTPKPESLIKKYSIVTFRSLTKVLAEKPDFAIIANPTNMHIPVAIEIGKANVPFLLEKPVSDSIAQINKLNDIVLKRKLPVLVGYNFRYHPGFRSVYEFIKNGYVGNPLSLHIQVGQWLPDWHPHQDYRKGYSAKLHCGGGAVLDLSHEIDAAIALFGPVRKVDAICGRFSSLKIETEDIAEINLLHSNNRVSHVHLDYCQRVYSKSLRLIGDRATVVWDCEENRIWLYPPDESRKKRMVLLPRFERDDMFRQQMRHWLDVLDGKCAPKVTLKDGIYVMKVALAAKMSSRKERHIYVN